MSASVRTRFLNIDLDLSSVEDLSPLAKAFEPGAFTLQTMTTTGGSFASLELAEHPKGAEEAIREFVALVEGLSEEARASWDGAARRTFAIGVEGGTEPNSFTVALSAEVVALAAGVGAGIEVVVYANDLKEHESSVALPPERSS